MIVLVSDTSVLIDLERGGLLEAAFACGHQLIVPDHLYATELEPENGPLLRELGLNIVELTSEEVEVAQAINSATPALSLADCFALSCARRPQHMLITGDKTLRSRAEGKNVSCGGLLWLLDQMEESGAIALVSLAEGLQKITSHPRCRLPKHEVAERLAKWAP
jgi:predicted nucleic acid-binding protein